MTSTIYFRLCKQVHRNRQTDGPTGPGCRFEAYPSNLLKQIERQEPGLVYGFWNKQRNVVRISVFTGDLAGNRCSIGWSN